MDFKIANFPVLSKLGPDDLMFFYYSVAYYSELGNLPQIADKDLIKVANDVGIKLTPLLQQTFISKKYNPGKNEIIFTYAKKMNSNIQILKYQDALLKHLRNSFAHYRISYTNGHELLIMEDSVSKGYTMRGLVELVKLKDLISQINECVEK